MNASEIASKVNQIKARRERGEHAQATVTEREFLHGVLRALFENRIADTKSAIRETLHTFDDRLKFECHDGNVVFVGPEPDEPPAPESTEGENTNGATKPE